MTAGIQQQKWSDKSSPKSICVPFFEVALALREVPSGIGLGVVANLIYQKVLSKVLEFVAMFCPFCGKQNQDNVSFCEFCGKALPKGSSPKPETRAFSQAPSSSRRVPASNAGLSFNAKKGIVTGVLVVVLVFVVLQLFYPGVFPWNL